MDDSFRRDISHAATEAEWQARREKVLGKVAQSQTTVDLPSENGDADPEVVSDRLTENLEPEVELTFDDPQYLALMEHELRRLGEAGELDGLNYIGDTPQRFTTDLKDRASGLYNPQTKELYVAPEEAIGEEPREREAEDGYFSTEKNMGSVWHELGHHRIRVENPDAVFEAEDSDEDYWGEYEKTQMGAEILEDRGEWDDVDSWFDPSSAGPVSKKKARKAMDEAIEDEVSEYAKWGGMEFIAEVYAGLLAGHTYSDTIMELHDRLDGPTPPESIRDPDSAFETMLPPDGSDAQFADGRVRRLSRIVDVTNVTHIGDDISVAFNIADASPSEIDSGIVFAPDGGVKEATFRFPPLQQASQATRGVTNRWPEMVKRSGPPEYDEFIALGTDGPQKAPTLGRKDRVIRTRLNDLRGTNKLRPHIILRTGAIATPFDADDVLDFLSDAIEAFGEEFPERAPRDDIEFQSAGGGPPIMDEEDINEAVRSLPGAWDVTKTDFERGEVAWEVHLGRSERPTSIIYDRDKQRLTSAIVRLPKLDPDLVRDDRGDAMSRFFSVFREADHAAHAIPQDKVDLLIAGPKGLTPHVEAMDPRADLLFEFIDVLTSAYMVEFGEPGDLLNYERGSTDISDFGGDPEPALAKTGDAAPREQIEEILASDDDAEIKRNRISAVVSDETNVPWVTLPWFDDLQMTADTALWLLNADSVGFLSNVGSISVLDVEAGQAKYGSFWYDRNKLRFGEWFPAEALREIHWKNKLVGWDMEGVVLHELGHAQHYERINEEGADFGLVDSSIATLPGQTRWDEDDARRRLEIAEEEVSAQARGNSGEFVAEVFAGLCLGYDYSDEIMDIYETFRGPEGWQDYREKFHPDGPSPPPKPEGGDVPDGVREPTEEEVFRLPNPAPGLPAPLENEARDVAASAERLRREIPRPAEGSTAPTAAQTTHAQGEDIARGPARAAAKKVIRHARGWGNRVEGRGVAGNAVVEFWPRGFPRPEKGFHDNPSVVSITEDGKLGDAIFRYGFIPEAGWDEQTEMVGVEIVDEMGQLDGTHITYDLGDFGDIARPHLKFEGVEFGDVSGDVDWTALMDYAEEFGERISEAYGFGDVQAATVPDEGSGDDDFDRLWDDAVHFDVMGESIRVARERAADVLEDHLAVETVRFEEIRPNHLRIIGKRLKKLDEVYDLSNVDLLGDASTDPSIEIGFKKAVGYFAPAAGPGDDEEHVVVKPRSFTKPTGRIVRDPDDWQVVNDQYQTFAHELVHYLHFHEFKRDEDDPKEAWENYYSELDPSTAEMLREEVSDYAATNAFEAVAEIGTGIMYGTEFPAEVMDLYERHNGPDVEPMDFGVVPPETEPPGVGVLEGQAAPGHNPWLAEARAVEQAFRDWFGVGGQLDAGENQPTPTAGGAPTAEAQIAHRRVERFESALRDVAAEEWVRDEFMIETFVDELARRITLGVRLFPEEPDINPSDIHFDSDSGLIVESLLRFPDVPGGPVALNGEEWQERTERIRDAVQSVPLPDGLRVNIESTMAAGHRGMTPHVEIAEDSKVTPREFAEWFNDVRVALAEEFGMNEGEWERPGYAHFVFSEPEDRRTALSKMHAEWGGEQFQSALRDLLAEASEDHFGMDAGRAFAEITNNTMQIHEGDLADFLEQQSDGAAQNFTILLLKVLRETERYERLEELGMVAEPRAGGDINVVGDPQSPEAMRLARQLSEWGATHIEVTDRHGEAVVDFKSPFPPFDGQPISSSATVADGMVREAILRLGVVRDDLWDKHPGTFRRPAEDLADAIEDVPLPGPGEPRIVTNWGDEHWPPRPHVLLNAGMVGGPVDSVVQSGGDDGAVSVDELVRYAKAVGERVRDAYGDDFDHGYEMAVAPVDSGGISDRVAGAATRAAVRAKAGGDDLSAEIEALKRQRAVTPSPGHSYRSFDPEGFWDIVDRVDALDDGMARYEHEQELQDVLRFIEDGRWLEFLRSTYLFFSKLDRDEMELFTERNPDLVQWIGLWAWTEDMNPYREWADRAAEIPTGTITSSRVGVADREYDRIPVEGFEHPPFRRSADTEATIRNMIDRRRSYRNWSPFEFAEATGVDELTFENRDEELSVPKPRLRELDYFDRMFHGDVDPDDFAEEVEVYRGTIVSLLMDRVEAGRYAEALDDGASFFARLDPDEQKVFVLRNPGISTWMGIYGQSRGLTGPHENDLSGAPWPPLREL